MKITPDIKLHNKKYKLCEYYKILGVVVFTEVKFIITWKVHILKIEQKFSKNICVINRVKNLLTKGILYTLYCSLVLPCLQYANVIRRINYRNKLKHLNILQERIVRIM